MENIKLLNPSVLAFVGDAVYSLLVRTRLSDKNRPSELLLRPFFPKRRESLFFQKTRIKKHPEALLLPGVLSGRGGRI